jgi:acyl-[acyl carrier protein]--UDP-N-acetylglucosamine O-acyltransferase
MAGLPRFVRIGGRGFVGACFSVPRDLPLGIEAGRNRAKPFGLNVLGQRWHGVPAQVFLALNEAIRIVFMSALNFFGGLARLEAGGDTLPTVQRFIDAIRRSRCEISK